VKQPAANVVCAEKRRLVEEYGQATEAYLQSMHELRAKTPTSRKADYEQLRKAAESARRKAEKVRIALERHLSEHHC